MSEDVIMPRPGDASADCWVDEWKKAVGDFVELGEPICMVAIDKAVFELESPYEGELAEILVEPQTIVPPGTLLGRVKTGRSM